MKTKRSGYDIQKEADSKKHPYVRAFEYAIRHDSVNSPWRALNIWNMLESGLEEECSFFSLSMFLKYLKKYKHMEKADALVRLKYLVKNHGMNYLVKKHGGKCALDD